MPTPVDVAVGAGLHEHVAQRGRLHRAGQHRQPAGVGGELAQQAVARSPTDQVHHLDLAPGERGGPPDRAPVGQRQAVQDAAHRLRRALRRRLTGLPADLRDPARQLVARIQESAGRRAAVVAVDLPSGVDPDDGVVRPPVLRAGTTVTFGAVKAGLLLAPGRAAAGRVRLVDIGLGPDLARMRPVLRTCDPE